MKRRDFTLLTVIVISCLLGCAQQVRATDGKYAEFRVAGQTSLHGLYDPALEYTQDTGWLTYSLIEIPRISTCLAKSTDRGATWAYVQTINPSRDGSVIEGGQKISGVWREEVATLVHDPDDPGKEWKLFWHEYFARDPYQDQDRLFNHGWISYRTAPRPEGPWSEAKRLFAAKKLLAPGYQVEIDLNALHPDLADYRFFSEPAVLYRHGILYLSLEGSRRADGLGDWEARKIFLLASKDHGKSWSYLGPLLGYRDAETLGYVTLTAASLFEVDGDAYLLATPSGSLTKTDTHENGMYLFKFGGIETGALLRDSGGRLVIHDVVALAPEISDRGGHGDYDTGNTGGGIVIGQIKVPGLLEALFRNNNESIFKLVNTYKHVTKTGP